MRRYRVIKSFHAATRRYRAGDTITITDLSGVSERVIAAHCEEIADPPPSAPSASGEPLFAGTDYGDGGDNSSDGAGE